MADRVEADEPGRGGVVRAGLWGAAGLLLLTPLAAMQFSREVDWSAGDFALAGGLLAAAGIGAEAAVRMRRSPAYRGGAALALAAAVLIVLVSGAVGMIGSEDDVHNSLFLGVVVLALGGALAARFQAGGMAYAMAAAGMVHAGIALAGLSADPLGAVLSVGMASLWFLAAALFRKAAGEGEAR
jgi:hypothetical protein